MGTSPFAVPSLDALVAAGHEIVAVVTQPDRPSGRGRQMHSSSVKQSAERYGLPIFQPEKIREEDAVETVRSYAPLDFIVVTSFGQIIPQSILDIPKYGCINVHASLLPKYRGAAPIQYAVMMGEAKTGVTTMMMDAGLDTGDMLLVGETEIDSNETAGELEERLAKLGADLLIETIERLKLGNLPRTPQDNSQATVARSIKREQGKIDWNKSAMDIVNLVRAFSPRPGAFTSLNGAIIRVNSSEIGPEITTLGTDGSKIANNAIFGEGKTPGEVVEVTKDSVIVAAGEGSVRLIEVQPENRRRMNAGEFARGARLAPGVIFESISGE